MTLASGLGAQLGLAKESTYGTAVTVSKFYEIDTFTSVLDQTYQESVGLRANRLFQPSGRVKRTTRQAGGDLTMDVPTKQFGSILDLLHGNTVTPTLVGSSLAYLQTHNIGTSQPNKSATVQVNKPTSNAVDTPFTYPGTIVTGAQFSLDTGGILKASLTTDSQDETTPATTPAGASLASASYASGIDSWTHIDAALTYSGSPVAAVRSVNLTVTQPFREDRFFIGSGALKAKPIPNGFATVTGTLDAEWYDATAYAAFRAGTMASLVFTLTGPTAIETTFFPFIKFTLPATQIRGGSPALDGPDVLDASIPFNSFDDGTNPPLKIEYQSTDVTV